ncbi:MAG: hypothetical protein RLZZ116_1068 [Planctomycetota bacterium]|jgi:hypothetical protein
MPAGLHLPFVAFFGRTLAEYLEMFAISADELRAGTTLDCPSSPDSFVAEACALGCAVSGIDPMFAFEPAELDQRARKNLDESFVHIDAQRERLTFRDYPAFKRAKYEALDAFLRDYAANRGRYIAASLPVLPFADRSFDRVLAANFLFTYANTEFGGLYDGREFDLGFHLASVTEIARVARSEIRLTPMGSFDPPPRPHAYRDPVRTRLEDLGWRTELVPSAYQSGLAGFNDVLVARR